MGPLSVRILSVDKLEDHDENDDDGGDRKDAHRPVHALSARFLVVLCIFDVLLRFFRVLQSLPSVCNDLNQIWPLIMHFCVDFFRDRVNVGHELLHIIKLLLPLLDDFFNLISLASHLKLLDVQLLFLEQFLTFSLAKATQTHSAIVIHEGLASLD